MINDRRTAVIAMIITAILWSLGGVLIKLINGHALGIASGRALLAVIVIMIYNKFKFEKVSFKIFVGTVCYSFTVIGFVMANKLTTSANAIFLQFTAPIWVAILSYVFLKVNIRTSDIMSIAIITTGMLLFFIGKMEHGMMLGNILALLTGVAFAGFIVNLKTYKKGKTIYPILYGNILTALVGIPFYTEKMFYIDSLLPLLILGVFQIGISYILYSKAIEHLSAIDAIIIPVIEPILNPIWVAIAIGEKMGMYSLVGGTIIIITIVVRNIHQTKAKRPQVV